MFAKLEDEARGAPAPPAGLKPHLLFRIPVVDGNPGKVRAMAAKLESFGISVVSTDSRGHIIAFKDDITLAALMTHSDAYTAGPKEGINPQTNSEYKGTGSDFLDLIDVSRMVSLAPEDRIGANLADLIGPDGNLIDRNQMYLVDVELWCDGLPGTAGFVRELEAVVKDRARDGERVRDTFRVGAVSLAKISVRGDKLAQILALAVVAEIDILAAVEFNPHSFPTSLRITFRRLIGRRLAARASVSLTPASRLGTLC